MWLITMNKEDKNKMADSLSNNGKQEVELLNFNFFFSLLYGKLEKQTSQAVHFFCAWNYTDPDFF